jgi:hypothetical protein
MTTSQYPLAICAILLTGEALIDLIIVRKLPQIDDVLSTSQHDQRRTEDTGFSRITLQKPKQTINALTIQLATLYNEIWTFIAGARFCFFFAVSLFIYTSGGKASSSVWEDNDDGQVKLGMEQVKSRVVFTYAFVEMMFWLWVCFLLPLSPKGCQTNDVYRHSRMCARNDGRWLLAWRSNKLPRTSGISISASQQRKGQCTIDTYYTITYAL